MGKPYVYDERSFEGPGGTWKTWRKNGMGRQADAPGPIDMEPDPAETLVVQKPDGETLELMLFVPPREMVRPRLEGFTGAQLAEEIIEAYGDLREWFGAT